MIMHSRLGGERSQTYFAEIRSVTHHLCKNWEWRSLDQAKQAFQTRALWKQFLVENFQVSPLYIAY